MDQILTELNLERFIEPFRLYQVDFSILAKVSISNAGYSESLRMDRSIENLLIKKCGIDTQSLIKICSAVEKLNKSRYNKYVPDVSSKGNTYPNIPLQVKPGNKRTQALLKASAAVQQKQQEAYLKPAPSIPTRETDRITDRPVKILTAALKHELIPVSVHNNSQPMLHPTFRQPYQDQNQVVVAYIDHKSFKEDIIVDKANEYPPLQQLLQNQNKISEQIDNQDSLIEPATENDAEIEESKESHIKSPQMAEQPNVNQWPDRDEKCNPLLMDSNCSYIEQKLKAYRESIIQQYGSSKVPSPFSPAQNLYSTTTACKNELQTELKEFLAAPENVNIGCDDELSQVIQEQPKSVPTLQQPSPRQDALMLDEYYEPKSSSQSEQSSNQEKPFEENSVVFNELVSLPNQAQSNKSSEYQKQVFDNQTGLDQIYALQNNEGMFNQEIQAIQQHDGQHPHAPEMSNPAITNQRDLYHHKSSSEQSESDNYDGTYIQEKEADINSVDSMDGEAFQRDKIPQIGEFDQEDHNQHENGQSLIDFVKQREMQNDQVSEDEDEEMDFTSRRGSYVQNEIPPRQQQVPKHNIGESQSSSQSQSDVSMDEDSERSEEVNQNNLFVQQEFTNQGAIKNSVQEPLEVQYQNQDMQDYSESVTSEVQDQTYEPTLPFSNDLSQDEQENDSESDEEQDSVGDETDEIEAQFANMPILYPTADASVQTTDVTFTSVADSVLVSTNMAVSPLLVSCETQWSPQQSPKSISVQVDLFRTSNSNSFNSNTAPDNQTAKEQRSIAHSPLRTQDAVKQTPNVDSFRSPIAKFVLNTMNNSQSHKANQQSNQSPTPKTQDSDTMYSHTINSVSPISKQLHKLNNPPPSKFTIPSPHLKEKSKRKQFAKSLKVRFEDLDGMPEQEIENELGKEEQIALDRSLVRKMHEEQRRKRIRDKQDRKREREARRQELGYPSHSSTQPTDRHSVGQKRPHKREYTQELSSDEELRRPSSKRHRTDQAESTARSVRGLQTMTEAQPPHPSSNLSPEGQLRFKEMQKQLLNSR